VQQGVQHAVLYSCAYVLSVEKGPILDILIRWSEPRRCPAFRKFQRGVVTWREMRPIVWARVHAAINRLIDHRSSTDLLFFTLMRLACLMFVFASWIGRGKETRYVFETLVWSGLRNLSGYIYNGMGHRERQAKTEHYNRPKEIKSLFHL
jgi:hypothetical protein